MALRGWLPGHRRELVETRDADNQTNIKDCKHAPTAASSKYLGSCHRREALS